MGYLDNKGLSHLWERMKAALSFKQDKLTVDPTLNLEDDVLSVTTPVKGMTQAEYDALPDKEISGLCIVTDAGISLKDRGEVYSTEETVIGTWIDGKPLYRKIYRIGPFGSVNGQVDLAALPDDLDMLVDIYGYLSKADNSAYYSMTNPWTCLIARTDNRHIVFQHTAVAAYADGIIFLTYTKTTDQEANE